MLARLVLVLLATAAVQFAPAAAAQKFQPGSNYICPNNADSGLDCYLDAVVHLYTMCRHVKSIEIIEFGLPEAQEGVNGAKSEYCVDKQKVEHRAAVPGGAEGGDALAGRRREPAHAPAVLARLDGEPQVAERRTARRLRRARRAGVRRVVVQDRQRARGVLDRAGRCGDRRRRRRPRRSRAPRRAPNPRPPRRRTEPPPHRGRRRGARRRRPRRRIRPTTPRSTPSSATAGRSRARFRDSVSGRSSSRWRRRSRGPSPQRGQLVAEAGTGTGKTFAYVVPALLYGGKVIISTGTKTLQDQLFERDLPLVRDALAAPVTVALLKGRANYVCHYHLERAAREDLLPTRDDIRHLPKIVAFARASERGDRAELADVPENAAIWPLVTSTRDNCLGQNCPHHAACFVLKARKDALDADVVVVNHHLFFADVMLRDEGVSELLPNCNTVILDEAHQLPDTATLFFGQQVTAGQLGGTGARRRDRGAHDGPRRARPARCGDRPGAGDPQAAPGGRRRARASFRATSRWRGAASRRRSTVSPRRSTGSRASCRISRSAARSSRRWPIVPAKPRAWSRAGATAATRSRTRRRKRRSGSGGST